MSADQILKVVVLGVAALIGILIVGQVGGVVLDAGVSSDEAEFDPVAGETKTLDEDVHERPTFLDISLTTGYGVDLDGDGSYVDASAPDDWSNNSWTACSVGALEEGVNTKDAYALLAYENETINIHYDDGEWAAIYYDNDSDTSARATVNATSEHQLTPVCARHNATADTLEVVADGNYSAPVDMTSEQATRASANDWNGTVDEVRLHPVAVDDSDLDRYSDEPAAGLTATTSARYMFEEGSGTSTSPYYHDEDAALVNADWTDGVADPDLEEGSDYEMGFDPLEITPLSGGLIEGSPVLYVDWDTGLGGAAKSIQAGAGDALSMVGIVMLVLIASVVLAQISRFR